jgi:uncharacterized protein YodC (DUF2158 family)
MTVSALQSSGSFTLGDQVSLLSGGPKMTVAGFETPPAAPGAPPPAAPVPGQPVLTTDLPLVRCIWFNEAGALANHPFPQWVLTGGTAGSKSGSASSNATL